MAAEIRGGLWSPTCRGGSSWLWRFEGGEGEEERSRLCPAGGRDGQGVSLRCHPATHAYICVTAPKPWRRGRHLPGISHSFCQRPFLQEGMGRRGHWNWTWQTWFRGSCTPTLFSFTPPSPEARSQSLPQAPSAQAWAWCWWENSKALRAQKGQGRDPSYSAGYPGAHTPQSSSHTESHAC